MAIRNINAPARSRKSRFTFTSEDVDAAGKILGEGGTPGEGGYDSLKEARSAAQSLKRAVEDAFEFADGQVVGTQGWEDDKGKGHFILRLKGGTE